MSARTASTGSRRRKPVTVAAKVVKPAPQPTSLLVGFVEKLVNRKWVRAEAQTTDPATGAIMYEQWPISATPELIYILTTDENDDEELDENEDNSSQDEFDADGNLVGSIDRTSDRPRPIANGCYNELPGNCDPTTKAYSVGQKKQIAKTVAHTLDVLQAHPWHDMVSQTGWTTTQEARYSKETGLPPRSWTKTARDKNDKVQHTWQIPVINLCQDFVRNFIPRMRDTGIEPEQIRVVLFLHCAAAVKSIVDLSKEQ